MAKRKKRVLSFGVILVLGSALLVGYYFYRLIYGPVLDMKSKTTVFYIHTGWNQDQVFDALAAKGIVKKPEALKWVMTRKNYNGGLIVPGKYTLKNGMSSSTLGNHLRAGNGEEEVKMY